MQKPVQLHKKQLHQFILLLLTVDKKKKHNGEYYMCSNGHTKLCTYVHIIMSVGYSLNRYTQYLKGAKRSGLKKEIITGLSMSVYFVILFGIGGLAYW